MKKFILLLAALSAAPVWAAKTVAVVPGNVEQVQSLDEVIVQGDRSLGAARKAIDDAEDRFYARWNDLNGDHKFDITCHLATPQDHPSRIWHRVCQPRFIDDLRQQQADQFSSAITGAMSADGGTVSMPAANPAVRLMTMELKKRTIAMLNKDPELKRALLERARLEQHYEALRKEKFRNHWIVWD